MTNGYYIRAMDNDRLSRFLWTWSINHLSSFLQYGGTRLMAGDDLRRWLDGEDFVCEETAVSEDMIYDQNFVLRMTAQKQMMEGEDNATINQS